MSLNQPLNPPLAKRFRGLLPVVIDIETSGLNPEQNGLLELAAVFLDFNGQGKLCPIETISFQIEPFLGAILDPESLLITGIDPTYPLRFALPEQQALHRLFLKTQDYLLQTGCQRAVLVGHNAWFDLAFLQAAIRRTAFKSSPFHSFTTFDTATLAGVALGETVLARAARAANISFDVNFAHSAIYDAEKTAELFCYIVNRY